MAKLCITFGQVHTHHINDVFLNKDCVAVIEADTIAEADELAFLLFNGKFHQHIDKELWDDNAMHYFPRGYIEVN